jgi:hypothetical protein
MNVVLAVLITLVVAFVATVGSIALYYVVRQRVTKAVRYAITLTNNQGSFVALCTQKRWDTWVFEDVFVTPTNPGGPVQKAADGRLHVPRRNILYYQEIVEVAGATQ